MTPASIELNAVMKVTEPITTLVRVLLMGEASRAASKDFVVLLLLPSAFCRMMSAKGLTVGMVDEVGFNMGMFWSSYDIVLGDFFFFPA